MLSLFDLQILAKTNPKKSAEQIKIFVEEKFSLRVLSLRINKSAVSLNSVNGFLKTPDGEFFFKFHAEENEKNFDEFYRAEILEGAGFPVLKPLFISKKPGEQFVIYEKISDPTFFEICEKADDQFLRTGKYDENLRMEILSAESRLCEKCSEVFKETIRFAPRTEVSQEPIWQLFSHRLFGDNCRLEKFYFEKDVLFPNGQKMKFEDFSQLKWKINGKRYNENLSEIIALAQKYLNPNANKEWVVCTAHGDDHNGNKFFVDKDLIYFDPVFSGNAIPLLLAPAKTTFHDVFAHPFWFYSSERIFEKLKITIEISQNEISVSHNFLIEEVAPIRAEILNIKAEKLWRPIFEKISSKDKAKAHDFVRKALFSCGFLCLDFLKFDAKFSIFAFARAVEIASADSDFLTEL